MNGVCDGPYEDLADLYAEETHVTHPFHPLNPPPLRSRSELHEHFTAPPPVARTLNRKPVDVTIHETADPEVIVAEFAYQGRVAETGEAFTVPCVFVMRIRNGLIIESGTTSTTSPARGLGVDSTAFDRTPSAGEHHHRGRSPTLMHARALLSHRSSTVGGLRLHGDHRHSPLRSDIDESLSVDMGCPQALGAGTRCRYERGAGPGSCRLDEGKSG
ncbi:nuclear transport factor 2 family protein [Micromonospora sp. M12]